ncbi:putative restriction endonuclease [Tamaricihabitans halophyticus]|uniref:Putative restriction endonuclease n=1 Tax=Tamaricihabitans halophyticus TaxID=1262583 RepID=A0A4R2R3H0_9PSEU|nr:Uma2 family endonuclease [Tamaricihabitans halophyticus]TCP57370.1 putative restriction endonuclease [Tamaricihabitans halophyticus]
MAVDPVTTPSGFDPLVEFYGMWNTELAERYLPIPHTHARKYECVGGNLIMSPAEGTTNSHGEGELFVRLRAGALAAGCYPYLQVNLRFTPDTWIQPDLVLLRAPACGVTWVDPADVLLSVEFVSPVSVRRDRVSKPELCASAGISWYLLVELDYPSRSADLRLYRLDDGRYVRHTAASAGGRFRVDEPLSLDFDPAELLEP